MSGVAGALQPLADSKDAVMREAATRRLLLYQAAALEVASGPLPEVNLLDLIVMLGTSRAVAERYWVPRVFGAKAQPLVVALADTEAEAWRVSDKILTPDQQVLLRGLIQAWLDEHPNQHAAESVRLADFSARAGTVATARAESAKGLLESVKHATQAVDEALLLSERALFLVHRLPFVLRLQGRLALQEALDDSVSTVARADVLFDELERTRPVLADLSRLAETTRGIVHESRLLVGALQPLLPAPESEQSQPPAGSDATLVDKLDSANQLADSAIALLREARAVMPEDIDARIDAMERRADRIVRRWIVYLVLLGGAWAILFWGGYLLVAHRLRASSSSSQHGSPHATTPEPFSPSSRG